MVNAPLVCAANACLGRIQRKLTWGYALAYAVGEGVRAQNRA